MEGKNAKDDATKPTDGSFQVARVAREKKVLSAGVLTAPKLVAESLEQPLSTHFTCDSPAKQTAAG